jgi:hypothetical protein
MSVHIGEEEGFTMMQPLCTDSYKGPIPWELHCSRIDKKVEAQCISPEMLIHGGNTYTTTVKGHKVG